MQLVFEIVLAIPALLLVAALWTGARHRRKLRAVSESRSVGVPAQETPPPPPSPTLRHSDTPSQSTLSESTFETALIHVEQLRAAGKHAEADAALASLHGQAPPVAPARPAMAAQLGGAT